MAQHSASIIRRRDFAAAGFRALIKWLGKAPVARIVFEPTGPYHRGFETALSGRFPLVKVNPLQARRFAEARGAEQLALDTPCGHLGLGCKADTVATTVRRFLRSD